MLNEFEQDVRHGLGRRHLRRDFVACYVPARRAATLDPVAALRDG